MQQDKYELQKLKQAAFLEKNIILNRRIWKNCSKQFLFYINFLNWVLSEQSFEFNVLKIFDCYLVLTRPDFQFGFLCSRLFCFPF